jgi:alpha-D-xyloside xylohydrolase
VTTPQATSRAVYLPAGTTWVDFWTGETLPGGQTVTASAPISILPLFIRAGSIVPLGPVLQYATEKPEDPIELRVYRGADGQFTLYEDENDNYDYEKGVFATIPFTWNETKQTLTIGRRSGKFPGMLTERTFRVVFVSPNHGAGLAAEERTDAVVRYTGKAITVSCKFNRP